MRTIATTLFNAGTDVQKRGMVFAPVSAYGGAGSPYSGLNTNSARASNTVFRIDGTTWTTGTGVTPDTLIEILNSVRVKRENVTNIQISPYVAPVKQVSTIVFTLSGTTTSLTAGSQISLFVNYLQGFEWVGGENQQFEVVPGRNYDYPILTATALSTTVGGAYDLIFKGLQKQLLNDPKSPAILSNIVLSTGGGNTIATLTFTAKTAGVGFNASMLSQNQLIYGTTSFVSSVYTVTTANVVGFGTPDMVQSIIGRSDRITWVSPEVYQTAVGAQYARVFIAFKNIDLGNMAPNGNSIELGDAQIELWFDENSSVWSGAGGISEFFTDFAVMV